MMIARGKLSCHLMSRDHKNYANFVISCLLPANSFTSLVLYCGLIRNDNAGSEDASGHHAKHAKEISRNEVFS